MGGSVVLVSVTNLSDEFESRPVHCQVAKILGQLSLPSLRGR